jgi:LacI family transcriptional regulator
MERAAGYTQAMKRAKLPVQICSVGAMGGNLSDQLGFALSSSTPPTAIFTGSDLIAFLTLHELRKRSISMPDEIALIAFDDFDAATLLTPAITVIRQPVSDLGRQAAERLCTQINDPAAASGAKITLKTELVIRGSCGCTAESNAEPNFDIRSRRPAYDFAT